jgi:hypothetical protein
MGGDAYAIALAMREGMPTKKPVCDGCGEKTKFGELTPHGYILCPRCRDLFLEEAKEAIAGALFGDKLLGFVDEDEILYFLYRQLERLVEIE